MNDLNFSFPPNWCVSLVTAIVPASPPVTHLHLFHLLIGPLVHRDTPHKRNMDTEPCNESSSYDEQETHLDEHLNIRDR